MMSDDALLNDDDLLDETALFDDELLDDDLLEDENKSSESPEVVCLPLIIAFIHIMFLEEC